jgi:nodulation protein F
MESKMDDVASKIVEILKKHMKKPKDDIGLQTPLSDLEIESLDLAMIVFDIEDSFAIQIPYNANEDTSDFKTVGSSSSVSAAWSAPRARRPDEGCALMRRAHP